MSSNLVKGHIAALCTSS